MCMYVCMYACVCARKCGSPVCEFRVWLGVGCVLHALVRVLSVKWVWFELRCGACVCVCTFCRLYVSAWLEWDCVGAVWMWVCSMYASAGVCGRAVVYVCVQGVYACVPGEACVHMFVWCVFTLSCVGSRWVNGR